MALEIPTYETEHGIDVTPAYVTITSLSFDLNRGTGRVNLTVHPSLAKADRIPAGTISVSFGELMAPGQRMPALATLMNDAQFATAWRTIIAKIYTGLAGHPKLTGATTRPPNTR